MAAKSVPYLLQLDNIVDEAVGGKARGLARLIKLGLNVPPGFVILNASIDSFPHDLLSAYTAIGGGKVAVRSSALGEDAADHSFAGQFETRLNVDGEQSLKEAINACLASLQLKRAQAYQQSRGHQQETTMCVVVQVMVDALAAGVLFTADPVSGRYDRMVIDAVAGLGEALVSGEASSDHYLLSGNNTVLEEELVGENRLLNDAQISLLANEARMAAEEMEEPLDLEWAIDKAGNLFWLQARPITTIGLDLDALNTQVNTRHVITRCNIGEIFPGPSCPLTFSLQGEALDISLQYMQRRFMGLSEQHYQGAPQLVYVGGHMFLDLTASLDASRYTMLSRAETTAQSICGRTIPELIEPIDKKSFLRRLWGVRDFILYIREAHNNTTDFAMKMKGFYISYGHDSLTLLQEISAKKSWLIEATKVHLQSSAMSGALEGLIQGVISKGAVSPSLDEQALAAKLFSGASGVESALLVEQLDNIVDLIASHPRAKEDFYSVSAQQALAWINSPASGGVQKAFSAFLDLHGHRSYRELCFMQKAWVDDPEVLVESMQASLMSRFVHAKARAEEKPVDLSAQPWLIRYFLPKAHNAIRRREYSKSMMVKVTHLLKRAYRHLGELMAQEGKIAEAELVFFFLHGELELFLNGSAPELAEIVKKRRISYQFQQRLHYADIAVGKPQPLESAKVHLLDGQLKGRPVSKGVVEGVVRVAMNVAEAAQLQPGEILVAPVTDVGWTPYFSLIAGLITDVGSAVSHGAVIAREYGLPCIVSALGATDALKTGNRVRLDADTGVITVLP